MRRIQPLRIPPKTLTLIAGVLFEGEAAVEEGRLFYDFISKLFEGNKKDIAIPADDVFTAQFDIKGTATAIEDYYQFKFSRQVPIGTKLTLTVISAGVTKYYYNVVETATDVIKVTDFVEMGQGASPATGPINEYHSQTFLLAMDFLKVGTAAEKTTIQSQYYSTQLQSALDITGAAVTYTLEEVVKATIKADTASVTVTLPTSSVYQDEKFALVAKIGKLPADVKASLNNGAIVGTPIGRGLVFPIDKTGGTYAYTIEGMDESYTITWALVLLEDGINVMGVSLAESTPVEVAVTTETPELNITVDSIDDGTLNSNTRTLQQGVAHTVVLTVNKKTGEYTMSGEVQNTTLANFISCDSITFTPESAGQITATFPATLEEGVYRLCFSLTDGSKNDNVYFTFVVVK